MKLPIIFFCLLLLISPNAFAANVPSNVTLTATESTVSVDWTGHNDADKYYVYWGTTSGNLDNRVTVDDSVTEYTITGLESGTTYYVAVSSVENSNESERSDTKSVTTLSDTGIPSTPTGFTITGINQIGETTVRLKWNKNTESDFDHYNIYYSLTAGAYDNVLTATDADTTAFTVSGLASSSRYYFSISAVDTSENESEKTKELIIDTLIDNLPPNKPAGISGALNDAHSIAVTIQNGNLQMADFTGNIVYYGNTEDNLDNRIDIGNSFTFVLSDLPLGTTWYFAASSYDFSENEGALTNVISLTVEQTSRFLNQPEDFDGGCFIRSAVQGTGSGNLFFILMVGILSVMSVKRKMTGLVRIFLMICLLSMSLSSVSHAENSPEMPGNNIVGLSVGYYLPLESDFKDYYGEDIFPVYGFYERFFNQYFSVDVESGFIKEKGHLLTESGESTRIKTKITLVPVSASLNFNLTLLPYVVGYIGAGPDYWYCQEETDDVAEHPEIEEWVGGFHGKAGVRLYNTDEKFKGSGALVESSYSRIDRFGDNKTDIGGWSFKFGIFYQF